MADPSKIPNGEAAAGTNPRPNQTTAIHSQNSSLSNPQHNQTKRAGRNRSNPQQNHSRRNSKSNASSQSMNRQQHQSPQLQSEVHLSTNNQRQANSQHPIPRPQKETQTALSPPSSGVSLPSSSQPHTKPRDSNTSRRRPRNRGRRSSQPVQDPSDAESIAAPSETHSEPKGQGRHRNRNRDRNRNRNRKKSDSGGPVPVGVGNGTTLVAGPSDSLHGIDEGDEDSALYDKTTDTLAGAKQQTNESPSGVMDEIQGQGGRRNRNRNRDRNRKDNLSKRATDPPSDEKSSSLDSLNIADLTIKEDEDNALYYNPQDTVAGASRPINCTPQPLPLDNDNDTASEPQGLGGRCPRNRPRQRTRNRSSNSIASSHQSSTSQFNPRTQKAPTKQKRSSTAGPLDSLHEIIGSEEGAADSGIILDTSPNTVAGAKDNTAAKPTTTTTKSKGKKQGKGKSKVVRAQRDDDDSDSDDDGEGKKKSRNDVSLRIELNLDVDLELKASLRGDVVIGLLT